MNHLRTLAALFGALILAAVAALSPASAQSYTAISNSSFASNTAASPSANPGSVGKGWIDVAGNVWAVAATYIDPTLVGGSPWNTGLLARQASENTAAAVTQKIETDFSAYQNNSTLYEACHYKANGTTPTEYIAGFSEPGSNTTGGIQVFAVTAGSLGSQINASGTGTYNTGSTGAALTLRTECTQTSSTATQIKVTLLNGATTLTTLTVTDSTAALQNIASGMAMFEYVNTSGNLQPVTAARTYSAGAVSYTTLPVTSPALLFTPGNWKGDTGRAGSVYRQTWNNGACFTAVWSASASPAANIVLPSTSTSAAISYTLNGTLTDNVAATGPIAITPVASVTNTLKACVRNNAQTARWGQASAAGNTVQVDGLQIDTSSTAGTAPTARPWVLVIGDSISDGIESNNGVDDWLLNYTYYLTQALDQVRSSAAPGGYDVAQSAAGYSGWVQPGDSTGDIPGFCIVASGVCGASSRVGLIDSGVSMLDSAGQLSSYGATGTQPAAIVINYGTNEALSTVNTTTMQTAVTDSLVSLRAAAPAAKIIVLVPFGLQYAGRFSSSYVTALTAGVAAYQSAHPSDVNVILYNAGQTLANALESSGTLYLNSASSSTSDVHPNTAGQALVAAPVIQAVVSALRPASGVLTVGP